MQAPALLAVAFLGTCSGCGTEPKEERRAGNAVAELGTGEASFELLEDGQLVPLIAGSQGGFHVWMSFRAYGFLGTRLDTVIKTELVLDSDAASGAGTRISDLPLKFEPTPDGGLQFLGWPGIVDPNLCPVGRELRLRVEISEAGAHAVDEKRVIVDGSVASRLPASCSSGI
jgi:hypothetical protein